MPEERALMVLTGEVDDLQAENTDLKVRLTILEAKMVSVFEELGLPNNQNTPPSPNRAT